MRHPICFLATAQPEAARIFYSETLGLSLSEASPYALVFMDGDIMLRIQIVPDVAPAPYTAHGWQVDNIAAEVRELDAKDVTFLQFDGLPQDADGVWTTPDGAKIAWFKDPCGNILSLTEIPPAREPPYIAR